jgi:hypothetical protein
VSDREEFVSVQQDRAEQVGGAVPGQRVAPESPGPPDANAARTDATWSPTDATWAPTVMGSAPVRPASTGAPAHAAPADPAAPGQPAAADQLASPQLATEPGAPAQRGVDETMVLPAFVTGKREAEPKPAEPARHQPGDALPPSERGMLIFVAALLGVGTLAVVTVLGLGGFSSKPAPAHTAPSPLVSVYPTPTPVDSASPADPSPSPASASPSTRRSPSPRALGSLTRTDPAAYCTYKKAGREHLREDGTWVCLGSAGHPGFLFTPTDVCRWRYLRTNSYAVVGNPADPATWKCFA